MSFIHNHSKVGLQHATPSLVYIEGTFLSLSSTYTFTIAGGHVPTAGNIIIITAGGTQTRSVTTPPTGFTYVPPATGMAAGTVAYFWKKATGLESGTYTIVWGGGSLAGGYVYSEWRNVEVDSNPVYANVSGNAIGTTLALPAVNILQPSLGFSANAKSLTDAWSADSGYVTYQGVGQYKVAYKSFSDQLANHILTWSGSSQSVNANILLLKGKALN